MPTSLPDIYVTSVAEGLAFQSASQAGQEALSAFPLIRGTIAVVPEQDAEALFEALDAKGIRTLPLG